VPRNTVGIGELAGASGLAIDRSSQRLFAADADAGRVAVFGLVPMPAVSTVAVTDITASSATLRGNVDPPPGEQVDSCWFEYGTDLSYELGEVPCAPAGPLTADTDVSAPVAGLTSLGTYHFRLAAIGENGITRYGEDRTFTATTGEPPAVSAVQASVNGATTATVTSTIDPMGATTVYRFEYGTSASYGAQTAISDPLAADDAAHSVSTTLTGLKPGVTYHVRAVAFSINGTTRSPDRSFNMPNRPVIVDGAAAGITQSKADLSATIRPGFLPTGYRFEYGPTTAYGSTIVGDAGSGDEPRTVTETASGLQPGTTYHFRVAASNAIGGDVSVDRTFTTAAAPPPPPVKKRCKRGFVRRKGKCVKRRRKAGKHRGRGKRVQRKGSQTHG
jgi:hypothetical protein